MLLMVSNVGKTEVYGRCDALQASRRIALLAANGEDLISNFTTYYNTRRSYIFALRTATYLGDLNQGKMTSGPRVR